MAREPSDHLGRIAKGGAGMTIGRAIDYLIGEYFDAMCEEHIQKPVSYALYQTWQWADGKEKPRKKEVQDADCD